MSKSYVLKATEFMKDITFVTIITNRKFQRIDLNMKYDTSFCIMLFPLGIPCVNISIFHCVWAVLAVLPMYLKRIYVLTMFY